MTSDELGLENVETKIKTLSKKRYDDLLEFFISVFFHDLPYDESNRAVELYKRIAVGKDKSEVRTVLRYACSASTECFKPSNYDFSALF